MQKLTYTTPVVEVSKWEAQDIITTSGIVTDTTSVSTIGDSNTTASVAYGDLK